MKKFRWTAEEWYRARNDRTTRVEGVGNFDDFSVGVVVDPKLVSAQAIQMMVLFSLNILARWCRKVTVQLPENPISLLAHREGEELQHILQKTMSDADPYGHFSFGAIDEKEVDQLLVIGRTQANLQKPHVWIDGTGWICGSGFGSVPEEKLDHEGSNPIGPAFASCLGMAELFGLASGTWKPTQHSSWYSLFDFSMSKKPLGLTNPEFLNTLDIGKLHQVGCGAVGSSLDYLLSFTKWNSTLDLIDFDVAEVSNCNRSLAISAFDAAERKAKARICEELLQNTHTNPCAYVGGYSQFITEKGFQASPPDVILCLANENNVWSTIQNNLPPLVLHATTTASWGINFGRHIPKKEWCIMCRFSEHVNTNYVPQCSEGVVSNNQTEEIQGVLPFLSTTAAILVLAEMAKMQVPHYPANEDFITFSTKQNGRFSKRQLYPKIGCICIDQPLGVYSTQVKGTRYWKFVGADTS